MADLSGCTVTIVDDTKANIDILLETLGGDYDMTVAMDGESALDDLAVSVPDLILLDIMMPGIDGYQVCAQLKSDPKTKDIPVIFITALSEDQDEAKGLLLGAVDYIRKPFCPELVKIRVKNQLELKNYRDRLEELVKERTRELELTQEVTIESMGTLAEYRDPETGGHIKRTQRYIKVLAEHLGKKQKYQESTEILSKPINSYTSS